MFTLIVEINNINSNFLLNYLVAFSTEFAPT